MTSKTIMKMLTCFFVPTSLLGLFYLFEDKIDIHGTNLGNIIAVVIAPVCLAFIGDMIILNNHVEKKAIKLFVVFLSFLAAIHAIQMVYLPYEVWKHVLWIPNTIDDISKIILNIIVSLSLVVLLIS